MRRARRRPRSKKIRFRNFRDGFLRRMAGLTRGKGAKTARSHGISRRIKRNVLLCRQRGTERRRKFCIGDNIAGAVGMKYSKSEVEQTIPQSAMRQTAPFAQGSHGGGSDGFAQGSHDVGRGTKPTPFMPPFMVRGSVALTNHASPYGKGRCHKVTEGIRVNPQKERHLLCSFCPYSARSAEQERKGTLPQRGKEGGAI